MTRKNHPSLRLTRRQALAALAVPAIALAVPTLAQAAPLTPGASASAAGYLYVNLNVTGANQVAGFSRASDGTLTSLPSSPFAIGGAGTSAALGSQGSLQYASRGPFLLAVDAGSNQISVLRVHVDGSLSPVPGSPFSSGGLDPVSIAIHNSFVYVANAGAGGSNYTGFSLARNGTLVPIAGSTVTVPDGAGIGDVLVSANGQHLAGTRVTTSLVDSFTIDRGGLLSVAPGSPYVAQGAGPFGSGFRPTNGNQLFVTNAHGGAGAGTVSAFAVASNGALTGIGSSPYPDQQTAPCWMTISPDGKYLFAANAGSDSISSYAIDLAGELTLVGSTLLKQGTGSGSLGTFDLKFDPTGSYLYQLDGNLKAVSILAVNGGVLTELASSPVSLPVTGSPFGIVVT